MPSAAKSSTLLIGAYTALLRIYPAPYRRAWGRAMEATFARRADEVRLQGARRRLRFALREFGSLLATAFGEWRSRLEVALPGRSELPVPISTPPRSPRRDVVTDFIFDIRIALRSWRREPGTMVVVVVTLALGIGATTAIFSVVDAVVLRPLPFPEADRLVQVSELQADGEPWSLSMPDFVDYRDQVTLLDAVAVYDTASLTLTGAGDPERIAGMEVTSGFFEMLGVDAPHGRTFNRTDEAEDAPLTVMLGHSFWLARFAGNPDVLGDMLHIDGRPRTIIGIAPPGIRLGRSEPELWLPWPITAAGMVNRGGHMYPVMGRLAAAASFEAARHEIDSIGARITSEYGDTHESSAGATIIPLRAQILGDVDQPLFVLLAAVAMLLLIACANVTSIMLARADARAREIAVRAALGAGAARLVRQLLVESLLLASAGGVIGVLVARLGVGAIVGNLAANLPRASEISTDVRVLVFALIVTWATGVAVGLAPALRVLRRDLYSPITAGAPAQSGSAGRTSLRRGLVVAEVGLAVMLVLGAVLFLQSLIKLRGVESGFDSQGAVTFRVGLPTSRYDTPEAIVAFMRRLEGELQSVAGVEAAGAIGLLPFFSSQTTGLSIVGDPDSVAERVQFRHTTPGFFEAMGTRVLRGRGIEERDVEGAQSVIVINQALARTLFGDGDPLGRRVTTGWGHHPDELEVVGVVEDVKLAGLTRPAPPAMYWPFGQYDWRSTMSFVVRTADDPAGLIPTLRSTVTRLDAELPIYSTESLTERTQRSFAEERLVTWLLAAFAALALLLGAVGIFGVMAYNVVQRTREIGVRLALGASPAEVILGVLGEGTRLTAAGVILGALGALGLGRFLGHLLYDTKAGDPLTFATVAGLLVAVALLACVIPARRAARLDPMVVLRNL